MSKLHHTMDIKSAVMALSEGNPGAINVLMSCAINADAVDPDGGVLVALRELDSLEIYGPRIWVLFKDACGGDLRRFLLVLRASQLNCVTPKFLQDAATDSPLYTPWTEDVWPDLEGQVASQLPKFLKPAVST